MSDDSLNRSFVERKFRGREFEEAVNWQQIIQSMKQGDDQ